MTSLLRTTIALVAAATIAVTGFAACGDDDGSSDVPNLDGRWALDATALEPAIGGQITDQNRPTIEFAGTTASGFAGCNTFSTTVTYDDKKMSFGPLAMTRMACEEPASSIEAQFAALLESVEFYDRSGQTLRMRNSDSMVVLTFGTSSS